MFLLTDAEGWMHRLRLKAIKCKYKHKNGYKNNSLIV